MSWIIYKHTNKLNGKVYIGLTCRKLNVRWKKDGNGYDRQPKFYRAIKKYGWNNFSHEILEKDLPSIEEANKREIYYIDLYSSTNKKYGYNISKGGDGITMPSQPILQISKTVVPKVIKQWGSVEEASKFTKISSGLIYNVLNRHKCTGGGYYWCYKSDYKNWVPRPNKSIAFDDFEKELLISLFKQGIRAKDIAKKMSKPIRTIEYELSHLKLLYKIKWSQKDLDFLKKHYSSLGAKKCSIKLKKSFEAVKIMASKLKLKSLNSHIDERRKILCVETNKKYASIAIASKVSGIDSSALSKCCRGKQNTAGGYHWKYID